MDRDKVIKGLECCKEMGCLHCPYYRKNGEGPCPMYDAALVLLKAQEEHSVCTKENCPMNANTISDDCNLKTCPWRTEALTPKVSMSGLWYECPTCGRHLTKDIDHYCARCGRRIKWTETQQK